MSDFCEWVTNDGAIPSGSLTATKEMKHHFSFDSVTEIATDSHSFFPEQIFLPYKYA